MPLTAWPISPCTATTRMPLIAVWRMTVRGDNLEFHDSPFRQGIGKQRPSCLGACDLESWSTPVTTPCVRGGGGRGADRVTHLLSRPGGTASGGRSFRGWYGLVVRGADISGMTRFLGRLIETGEFTRRILQRLDG